MIGSASIQGFDFHCHLDLHSNPPEVIRQCASKGIAVVAVTTTPKAWQQNCKWAVGNPLIHVAAGLHPELVGERYAEVELLERLIGDSRFVGEVGLDCSPQYYPQQLEVFGRVLDRCQQLGGRVLTIHSRRAARDVVSMIEDRGGKERLICIMHWFSGATSEARKASSAGCYFSINSAMLSNDRGRELVKSLPEERLLTETDAPFTAFANRKALPWDVLDTAEQLASLRGVTREAMKRLLFENASRVLGFGGVELKG
jgi:TatD DNase family protein